MKGIHTPEPRGDYALVVITRVRGNLIAVVGTAAEIEPEGQPGVLYEALLPAYLAERLTPSVGERVELHTRQHLEAQGNGTSFVPRLLGFGSAQERAFFELFTTVKGLGARRALRALAATPPEIAAAVVAKDTKALTKLPEVGKKLAETIVVELSGKIEIYLDPGIASESGGGVIEQKPGQSGLNGSIDAPDGPMGEAVEALIALGQTRADAARMVERAAIKAGGPFDSVDDALAAVFGG